MLQSLALKGLHVLNDGRLTKAGALEPHTDLPISLLRFYREGVELEFLALGIPMKLEKQEHAGTVAIREEVVNGLSEELAADPEFRRAARLVSQRLRAGQDAADASGVDGDGT